MEKKGILCFETCQNKDILKLQDSGKKNKLSNDHYCLFTYKPIPNLMFAIHAISFLEGKEKEKG